MQSQNLPSSSSTFIQHHYLPLTSFTFTITISRSQHPPLQGQRLQNIVIAAHSVKMASKTLAEMLVRNKKFAQVYQSPPDLITMAKGARASGAGVIVLSCSDPRLNPYQVFGVDPTLKGLTMIRNAGGRAFDAIRTISALQTIGDAKAIVVMHHTDCGMSHFHDVHIREALLKFAPQEADTINSTKYGEILGSVEETIKEDVALLKASPFITPGTRIIGLKYDIMTGVAETLEE